MTATVTHPEYPGEKHTQPARLSAREIAHALGLNPPTDEQVRIIESPLEPRLVIAGAGSGKTATMVDRVVWLVANKIVRADEVLGVTLPARPQESCAIACALA